MRVFRGIPARADVPIALTIGNFDGVHLGHRAMIARLAEAARPHGLPVAVMTFEPQPQEFFAPDQAPARLTSLHEKLEILRDCGVDRVYVCRFDYAFAQLTANEFVSGMLHDGLAVRWLLVGDKLGAKIGYPTANVQLKRSKAPLSGIFVVEVDGLGSAPLPGVASLGVRPTVKERGRPTLEAHLFDFDGRIYGRRIGVRFLKKLRDEQKFAGIDALVAQMDKDAAAARDYFRTAKTQRRKGNAKEGE